ncbi:MAG: metalloregulator ArsR/SmtB family transcription factor [Sphaerochaetaceae bacterium]|nr:metalloregulator ArsR/SmtB family transcription factor [Sphaerochaetaceae bacterium]MDC7237647.1 metalloregulator ArsR/SmtB family transcription factor [Sphaerochaetaceae bacterium]MDC7243556.1 metalloregulator ArsR/SmtB family transcription factor [Sphaerochaetaceae bacterium]MDC7250715.1 metalloregulator ArsR/SmtB family transcription factor [Sphaerochaetaceae bacterium]
MIEEKLIISDFDSCCLFFKVLGDPTRMKIILALAKGPLCVNDLTKELKMEQSAISHQLKILKNAKVVKANKVGKNVFYAFDDDHVEKIIEIAIEHINHKKNEE